MKPGELFYFKFEYPLNPVVNKNDWGLVIESIPRRGNVDIVFFHLATGQKIKVTFDCWYMWRAQEWFQTYPMM